MANAELEDQRFVFGEIAKEASGFYRSTMTVASAFLGGSLLFVEKIYYVNHLCVVAILSVGWVSLVLAIGTIVRVRQLNVRSGTFRLTGDSDKAARIDKKKPEAKYASNGVSDSRYFLYNSVCDNKHICSDSTKGDYDE